jgi:hypothetical protein
LPISFPAGAAISNGPHCTNAVAAEQQRILQFNYAEQSFQQQLKVGRERYNQKQVNRAKVIAAMSSELEARQQGAVSQPLAAPDGKAAKPAGRSRLWLAVAVLAAVLGGLGYRLHRQRAQNEPVQQPQPILDPEPPVVPRSMAEEVFFCKGSGADGRGLHTQEGFVVLKGSIGRKENAPSIKGKPAEPLRLMLLDSGVTREEGDAIVFEKDHLFPTPSLAAIALMGMTVNGWLEWKTEDGITLDAVQRLEPSKFAA